jgi:peroxiredoxin
MPFSGKWAKSPGSTPSSQHQATEIFHGPARPSRRLQSRFRSRPSSAEATQGSAGHHASRDRRSDRIGTGAARQEGRRHRAGIHADGKEVSSRDLLAKGPLVVSFYRGVWCPYCNLELQALQATLQEIVARGASLVAISPQTAPNSRKSQRDNKLSFPILSDVKSEIANAFGIRFSLPDDLIELYKSFKNDLPTFNNDPSWVLPMPARYVIGTDGVIAYAEVNPDYTHRPDPSELLPVLDRLRASKAA